MTDFIKFIWDEGPIGKAILIFIVVGAPLAIAGVIMEQNEWNQFRLDHGCKIVAKERGNTSIGVAPVIGGSGGVAPVVMPNSSKTGWLCDDGITYWR